MGVKSHELYDYYIKVGFENPPISKEYREYRDWDQGVYNQKVYDFIKDMKVTGTASNDYIFTDPELIELRRQSIERELDPMRLRLQEELEAKQLREELEKKRNDNNLEISKKMVVK